MRLLGANHSGFTVSNLERSIDFYRDTLGLEMVGRWDVDKDYHNDIVGRLVGIPGAQAKIALLAVGSFVLELLEYVDPKGKPAAPLRPNDVGNTHVTFEVEDIEVAYKELLDKGVKVTAPPCYIAEGEFDGYSAIYFWDPDGIPMELVRRPKGP